jgi:aminoacrylate hydrolase
VEVGRQLAHFPPLETLERRIAAARDFKQLLDLTGDVLALAAADDVLVPPHCSEALADELPLGTFSVMKYGGHACNVTNPAAFNRLVLQYLGS